ncbi:MAG: hypothetical protein FJY91_03200 [Candidatus Harrisonbacteria bacterium]|nr:hypothetical protein [Candidatus Harrisonbacteria bacterium]
MATILCPRCHAEVFRSIKDPTTANMQCDNCGFVFLEEGETQNPLVSDDPLGCLQLLKRALQDQRLAELHKVSAIEADEEAFCPSWDGSNAAFKLAKSLGMCRLFGVNASTLIDCLSVSVAIAAAGELQTRLGDWIQRADDAEAEWLASESFGRLDACCTLLENRMEAWAIFRVLLESHATCFERTGFEASRLLNRLLAISELTMKFDTALQEQDRLELLSTIVDLPLLDNWRAFLADEFQQHLPWWLDGTLERVGDEVEQQALSLLPDRETALRRFKGV